jgi:hypothetical protein
VALHASPASTCWALSGCSWPQCLDPALHRSLVPRGKWLPLRQEHLLSRASRKEQAENCCASEPSTKPQGDEENNEPGDVDQQRQFVQSRSKGAPASRTPPECPGRDPQRETYRSDGSDSDRKYSSYACRPTCHRDSRNAQRRRCAASNGASLLRVGTSGMLCVMA